MIERMSAQFDAGLTEAFDTVVRGSARLVPALAAAMVVGGITWIAARLVFAGVRRVMARRSTQAHVDLLVARFFAGAVVAVGGVAMLAVLGVSLTALVASLGLAGLTLGFALRDVLANTVSGVLLLLQFPFTIGDTISVAGSEGAVVDVRVRDTILRMPDGRRVYVPNTAVFNGTVVNISSRSAVEFEIVLRAPAEADPTAARTYVLAAVAATPGVVREPAPMVSVASAPSDRLRLVARAWADAGAADVDAVRATALAAARLALQ